MRRQYLAPIALMIAAFVAPAAAHQRPAAPLPSVTQMDIQRLQDSVSRATTEVSQLRSRDTVRADRLQAELDELRDDVIYLKVKLRRERAVTRGEYADVRDRIDALRTLARDNTTGHDTESAVGPSTAAIVPGEIPAGTELDVRLFNSLSSGSAQVEDRFEATTLVDLRVGERTLIPAGSALRGVVTAVEPATRTNRTARMALSFDQVTVNSRAYPIRGTVTQAIEGEGLKGEAGRISAGAGAGAIIGGILGGFRGALAGIVIGGGGTIAATEGNQIELPQGTVLRVRIESPVQIGQ